MPKAPASRFEAEVLKMLANGQTATYIANALGISENNTVVDAGPSSPLGLLDGRTQVQFNRWFASSIGDASRPCIG